MKLLIVLAAILVATFADNRFCPHPDEAKRLIHSAPVVIENGGDGIRQEIRVDIPEEVIKDQAVSCISILTEGPDTAPAFLGAGRNRDRGISLNLSSKLGRPVEGMLYIYASGEGNVDPDEPEVDPEPVKNLQNMVKITYISHKS